MRRRTILLSGIEEFVEQLHGLLGAKFLRPDAEPSQALNDGGNALFKLYAGSVKGFLFLRRASAAETEHGRHLATSADRVDWQIWHDDEEMLGHDIGFLGKLPYEADVFVDLDLEEVFGHFSLALLQEVDIRLDVEPTRFREHLYWKFQGIQQTLELHEDGALFVFALEGDIERTCHENCPKLPCFERDDAVADAFYRYELLRRSALGHMNYSIQRKGKR